MPTSPHPSTFQRCLAIATRGCCVGLWSHGAFDTLLQGRRKYSSNVFLGQHSCACIAWLLLATLTLGRGGSVSKNIRLRGPSLGSVVLFKNGCRQCGASAVRNGQGICFFLLLESYIEVPVVKKHVLFSLSAVCFELNDFCLCCRLC